MKESEKKYLVKYFRRLLFKRSMGKRFAYSVRQRHNLNFSVYLDYVSPRNLIRSAIPDHVTYEELLKWRNLDEEWRKFIDKATKSKKI